MSPEARTTSAVLQTLRDEIAVDRRALTRTLSLVAGELDAFRTRQDAVTTGFIALQLHGYYTALEAIFERVARVVDGALPTGDEWHKRLLTQMQSDRDGRRPAIIDAQSATPTRALLAFRHFVRHSYGAELDASKVQTMAMTALAVAPTIDESLVALDAFLVAAIAAAESDG